MSGSFMSVCHPYATEEISNAIANRTVLLQQIPEGNLCKMPIKMKKKKRKQRKWKYLFLLGIKF